MVRTPGRYGLRLYDCSRIWDPWDSEKISARKCQRYSKNAGILGIPLGFGFYLPEQAARNQFLLVQSDTFGCADNALKMLGFDVGAQPPGIQVPVGRVPLLQKPTVRQNVSAAAGTLL